jgi:hypothetical protein
VRLTKTGVTLPDDKAQAVRLKRKDGERTVICLHGEAISEGGLIEANGRRGYGKVIAFAPGEPDGVTLAW